MSNTMVNIGIDNYEVWINAESNISLILSVHRYDMSDNFSEPVLMRSTMKIDGQGLDSPLTPKEIIKRLEEAREDVIPGVTGYRD